MAKFDVVLLGNRIRDARKECDLTQQELADQTGLAVKTIHDIEKGLKNPTCETLARLMERLDISPDTVFSTTPPALTESMKCLLVSLQLCDPKVQKILLKTYLFLAKQLQTLQGEIE